MKNKLIILTFLLVSSLVNAQNFYTCVPEDDWFNKQFDLRVLQEKFKVAKTLIDNNESWEFVEKNKTSGTLLQGIYKVEVAGGAGGKGGAINIVSKSDEGGKGGALTNMNRRGISILQKSCEGSMGQNGEVRKDIFLFVSSCIYDLKIGKKGVDGKSQDINMNGLEYNSADWFYQFGLANEVNNNGLDGNNSSFKACDFSLIAFGGRGGYGGKVNQYARELPCQKISFHNNTGRINLSDGYVRIYRYKG